MVPADRATYLGWPSSPCRVAGPSWPASPRWRPRTWQSPRAHRSTPGTENLPQYIQTIIIIKFFLYQIYQKFRSTRYWPWFCRIFRQTRLRIRIRFQPNKICNKLPFEELKKTTKIAQKIKKMELVQIYSIFKLKPPFSTNFLELFCVYPLFFPPGSGSAYWMRTRIQERKINADPDPQPFRRLYATVWLIFVTVSS